MSENNAMTEGAASDEGTTVKTEKCKFCHGSGYYTVYDEPYGLPVDVECCTGPIWDDADDDDEEEYDIDEIEAEQEAYWDRYRKRFGVDSVGPYPESCLDCAPGEGPRRCGHW